MSLHHPARAPYSTRPPIAIEQKNVVFQWNYKLHRCTQSANFHANIKLRIKQKLIESIKIRNQFCIFKFFIFASMNNKIWMHIFLLLKSMMIKFKWKVGNQNLLVDRMKVFSIVLYWSIHINHKKYSVYYQFEKNDYLLRI